MANNSPSSPAVFLQTRPTTCGVACTMMAMNFFLGTPLTASFEGKIRKRFKLKRFDIIPPISLARFMKTEGLSVVIVHQDAQKFWRTIGSISDDLLVEQEEAYQRARANGIKPEYRDVKAEDIKNLVRDGWLIMKGIELSSGIKHAVLIYGSSGEDFYLIDPLVGKTLKNERELMALGDMDTGRWYIAIRK
jgi:hypothetical protein